MKIQRLPESELVIMEVLWKSKEPLFAGEIKKQLPEKIDWKPSTLLTIISRLTEKGFIQSTKRGRYLTYFPAISEKEYLSLETKTFFQRMHKHSLKSFISTLYESKDITQDDIEEMMEWIKKKDSKSE